MQTITQRNPFGVRDAPSPDGPDVAAFAAGITRGDTGQDANSKPWHGVAADGAPAPLLEGRWCSRWNGGADPALPGDTPEQWKAGQARLAFANGRVYLLFDWGDGGRRALVEALRQGEHRLTGRYINLGNPDITRPWAGWIVDGQRIDGYWTNGRLDFRR